MENLRGMNAVVTGASRGLGVYIAKALAAEGVNVALAARTAEKLEETRRLCEAQGVRAVAVACDVTSRDDLQRLVQTAEQALGDIDIVVNNAGIEVAASIVDHSFEQLDELIRTNLNAPIWLTRLMLPGMMARGRGAVVNIASLAGKSPVPYGSVYAATKAALIGFTGSIEIELDATGVHAGVVCPSFVSEAGMWADYGQKAPWMAREVPPQKVAEAVLKAIRGAPEVLVSAGPIRPLLAAGELSPRLRQWFVKRIGIPDAMRAAARAEAARLKKHGDNALVAASRDGGEQGAQE